jgi:hypothetical protein
LNVDVFFAQHGFLQSLPHLMLPSAFLQGVVHLPEHLPAHLLEHCFFWQLRFELHVEQHPAVE